MQRHVSGLCRQQPVLVDTFFLLPLPFLKSIQLCCRFCVSASSLAKRCWLFQLFWSFFFLDLALSSSLSVISMYCITKNKLQERLMCLPYQTVITENDIGSGAVHTDCQQHQLTPCSHSPGMIDHFNSAAGHVLLYMPCKLVKTPDRPVAIAKRLGLARALQIHTHVQS